MKIQIGFIAYRNDNGNFENTEPIFAEYESHKNGELAEIEKTPLRQLGRWIFKRYKESEQADLGGQCVKADVR